MVLDPRRNADPARWGLVPDVDVREHFVDDDPAVAAAVADASRGRWEKAADLVVSTWGDWDRRAHVVEALAVVGARDDAWLNKWRDARPGDPHHAVVDADAWLRLAWEVGGDESTDPHLVLGKAEQAAQHATEVAPDDPTPWWTLTTFAREVAYDHELFGEVWSELVTRAPLHVPGHDQALQYWCEKWCGSHELMLEFAAQAAAKSPALASLPLKAAFEMEDDEPGAWRSPLVQGALDTLLARLADASDTKSVRIDRGYAILALFDHRRYAEAVDQFRELGPHADAAPWDRFDDPKGTFLAFRADACLHAS